MSEDLKPCPFCGKAAKVEKVKVMTTGEIEFTVRCKSEICMGHPEIPVSYETERKAASAWNRRKGEDDQGS